MTWYIAHAILYVRYKNGAQTEYPVWENMYLIAAESEEDAWTAAEHRGAEAASDADDSFIWNDIPAEWVFAGIRKLIQVAHHDVNTHPASGDELSYSEFTLPSLSTVQQLAAGETVTLDYVA